MRGARRLGLVSIGCQYLPPHLAYYEGEKAKLGEGEGATLGEGEKAKLGEGERLIYNAGQFDK